MLDALADDVDTSCKLNSDTVKLFGSEIVWLTRNAIQNKELFLFQLVTMAMKTTSESVNTYAVHTTQAEDFNPTYCQRYI